MAVDRQALRADMQRNREEIARRQIELDNCHEAVMEGTRAVLKRAEEADEPMIYSRPIISPIVSKAEELAAGNDVMMDAVAVALARTRDELRDEFNAAVERSQAPLRENIARLEGQLATLMMMLGEKSKRRK